MTTDRPFSLFHLFVLVEYDGDYNTYVARCLQTGSVATADDPDTVVDMIKELLADEVSYAVERDTLANLFSRPAPMAIWNRFSRAIQAQAMPPKPMQKAVTSGNSEEVSTEITIALSTKATAA